jgi:hypothetical protein
MTLPNLGRFFLAALGLSVVGACSSRPDPNSQIKLVPVHGVVRLNGTPVEGARVTFNNVQLGVSAYGLTDAEGKFTLTSFHPGDGVTPGMQQITVSKAQETGHPTAKTAPPVFRQGAAPKPRWLIPQKYSDPQTSGLSREVTETGDNDFTLDLQGS